MRELIVSFKSSTSVNDFVKIAESSACDIDAVSGMYTLDGKSLLGMLSMDLSKPTKIKIISDNKEDIDSLVAKISDLGIIQD